MIRQVERLEALGVPRMKFLSHVLAVNLVNNHVEFVVVGKDAHLKLPAPGSTLTHQPDVAGDGDVVLHEKFVVLLIRL